MSTPGAADLRLTDRSDVLLAVEEADTVARKPWRRPRHTPTGTIQREGEGVAMIALQAETSRGGEMQDVGP